MSRALRASALEPDVRAVLSRGVVDGTLYRLPPDQLERALYVKINEALEALGGKWNRKLKGHVFAVSPTEVFADMMGTGVVPAKNPDAFFPTPRDVVDEMLRLAVLDELPRDRPTLLLEPSAGTGAIATVAFLRAPMTCAVHCVEMNPLRSDALREVMMLVSRGHPALGTPASPPVVWTGDFLNWGRGAGEYDRILMNPPFAVDEDATAWLTHIERAESQFLRGTGRLVSVVPSNYESRTDRKHSAFRQKIAGRSEYFPLPDNAFAKSGTGASCGLLIVVGAA